MASRPPDAIRQTAVNRARFPFLDLLITIDLDNIHVIIETRYYRKEFLKLFRTFVTRCFTRVLRLMVRAEFRLSCWLRSAHIRRTSDCRLRATWQQDDNRDEHRQTARGSQRRSRA